jgi:hypothetical protein
MMPVCNATVTALTMERSGGAFTSSSIKNVKTRQKRKICNNQWADLTWKALKD